MNKMLLMLLVFLCTACERIPSKVYEIETVDGKIFKISCPAVNPARSRLTYLIENYCVVIKS